MGLVIVVLTARFFGYDALADPVGWALVVAGAWPLRDRIPYGGAVLGLAVVAGLVAVPVFVPAFDDLLAPSAQWAASLPQTLFCLVLCMSLGRLAHEAGDRESDRFGLLRWVFAAVALGPVLVYGGGVEALATPVAVLAVLADVALIYYVFKVSRRSYGTAESTPSAVE